MGRLEMILSGRRELLGEGVFSQIPVSLTSWGPRIPDLPLVLLTLLQQNVRPSAIYLWLTAQDHKMLDPAVVRLFEPHGLRVRVCDDLRSHKKWLPMIESGMMEPFVICDDDILYPKSWFGSLIREHREGIYVGTKCHRMVRDASGRILPYDRWYKQIQWTGEASHSTFITGCGGALIDPRRLQERFFDRDTIMAKCPRADDVWLKAAHQASGIPCYKTRYSFPCLELPGSGAVGLANSNVGECGNDEQILNVADLLEDC